MKGWVSDNSPKRELGVGRSLGRSFGELCRGLPGGLPPLEDDSAGRGCEGRVSSRDRVIERPGRDDYGLAETGDVLRESGQIAVDQLSGVLI